MIRVHSAANGQWKENSYVLTCDTVGQATDCVPSATNSKTAIIIDPGEDYEQLVEYIRLEGLLPIAIVNTHAHYDHVSGVEELKKLYQIPFYLHSGDFKLLSQANFYRVLFGGKKNITVPKVEFDLKPYADQVSVLRIGEFALKVVAAPGHTQGGVVLECEGKLFTGDNIVGRQIGRSDLPGGNLQVLKQTLEKIYAYPGETEIYPGHGRMFLLNTVIREASKPLDASELAGHLTASDVP